MNKRSPSSAVRVAFSLIVVAEVCLCVAVLVPGIRDLHRRGREKEGLEAEVEAKQEHNGQLTREIQSLDTDKGIERVARDELRLVKPGELVFFFEKKPRLHREVNPGAPGERRP